MEHITAGDVNTDVSVAMPQMQFGGNRCLSGVVD